MSLQEPTRRSKLVLQKLLVALIVLSLLTLPAPVFAQDSGDGTDGSDGRPPDLFLPLVSQDGVGRAAEMTAEEEAANALVEASGEAKSKAIFFVADGLRQDLVEGFAAERGAMPAMGKLLRTGIKAEGNGLLTQAPPNTGAGWFSLATGAWSGVHGSTNNTFHVNGQAFTSRTAAFDAGVPQAESLAQAAERGEKRVVQIEWAGGRSSAINGPTVD
jgi:hypothetical protein